MHEYGFNNTGAPIAKGTPVYVSGYNIGADLSEIATSKAGDSATMPCYGLAEVTIAHGSRGMVMASGTIEGLNTSAYSVGDQLYVAATGGLTNVRPTGLAKVQKVAQVVRSNAVTGAIHVFGAGRVNDVPNISDSYVWVGSSSGEAVSTPLANIDLSVLSNATAGFVTQGQVNVSVTYENLNTNGDVGTTNGQVMPGTKLFDERYASGSHVARHESGGVDELDGDHLDIDYTPSNYTPTTAPAEASSVDHLAAHLAGIDSALVGATSPATDTQVLFNDGGTTVGDSGLWYNKTTKTLNVTGSVVVGSASATSPNFVLASDISPSSVAAGSVWRGTWMGQTGYWLWNGAQIVRLDKTSRIIDIGAVASNSLVQTNSNIAGDFRPAMAGTLSYVAAYVQTAPGVPFKAYVLKNGANILSTPIWIDATEKSSHTAVTAAVISTSTVAAWDIFTISSEVVGGAKGLHVILVEDTYPTWVN